MQIEPEQREAARAALLDALTAEHRMRRQAVKAVQEAARWDERAALAAARHLPDLAMGAQARAAQHRRLAGLWSRRADELHAEVRQLRDLATTQPGAGRAPPDRLEAQFAALAIEVELERLRARRRGGAEATARESA